MYNLPFQASLLPYAIGYGTRIYLERCMFGVRGRKWMDGVVHSVHNAPSTTYTLALQGGSPSLSLTPALRQSVR